MCLITAPPGLAPLTSQEACVALWPACRVTIFGSFFTGLSLPNGDVDVAVRLACERRAPASVGRAPGVRSCLGRFLSWS